MIGTHALSLAAGRVSSGVSIPSIIFMALFATAGILLTFNVLGFAERFDNLLSKLSFGLVAVFDTGLYRVVGAGITLLGVIGVTVELVVGLT